MGCWNGTCFISNLPIMAGQPVVGFVIEYFSWSKGKGNYSGVCYPNDFANPFAMSFEGTYDDYGGIENVDSDSVAIKYLLNLFNATDPLELIRDIERDEKTITLYRTEQENNVGLIMAHKSIVDRLVSSYTKSRYGYNVDVDDLVSKLGDIRDFNTRKDDLQKALDSGGPNALDREDLRVLLGFVSGPEMLGLHVDILERKDYQHMINFVILLNKEKYDKEFAQILKRDHIIRSSMHKLRKLWIGPAGKGSQSKYHSEHLKLIEAMKEHIFDSFRDPADAYRTFLGEDEW